MMRYSSCKQELSRALTPLARHSSQNLPISLRSGTTGYIWRAGQSLQPALVFSWKFRFACKHKNCAIDQGFAETTSQTNVQALTPGVRRTANACSTLPRRQPSIEAAMRSSCFICRLIKLIRNAGEKTRCRQKDARSISTFTPSLHE